jgi:hypothetical protein
MLLVLCLGWGDLLFSLLSLSNDITTRKAEGFNLGGVEAVGDSKLSAAWCKIGPHRKRWAIINTSTLRGLRR